MRSRLVDAHSRKETRDESAAQKTKQLSWRRAWQQNRVRKFSARPSNWQWGGNVAMIKFLLDRILPKERAIPLELPPLTYAPDSVDAMAKIVDAVSSGRISPREAADVAQVVSAFTRAIDVTEVQNEVDLVKSKLDGRNSNLQALIDRKRG